MSQRVVEMTMPEFERRMKLFLEGVANDLSNELARAVPVDTGALKNSIHYEVLPDGQILIKMLEYAKHVEYGTAPHIIRPVNAKALSWKPRGGERVFAQVVHHPGTDPQPFIRNTFRTKLRKILGENARRHLLR
jgi:hypothetical protein